MTVRPMAAGRAPAASVPRYQDRPRRDGDRPSYAAGRVAAVRPRIGRGGMMIVRPTVIARGAMVIVRRMATGPRSRTIAPVR